MTDRRPAERSFYLRFALAMIGLLVVGFGGRALRSSDEVPPALSILLPHIACIGGWYGLFLVQAALVQSGRRRLHQSLGLLSLPLALGVLWTGVLVMAANYRLKHDAPLVFFNLLNLTQFAALYTAALVLRRQNPSAHKRLLLYASLAMLPPALVRAVQALGLPEVLTVVPIVALWIPGIVHDRRRHGRVHPATWVGIATILSGLAVGGPVGFSETWSDFVARTIR